MARLRQGILKESKIKDWRGKNMEEYKYEIPKVLMQFRGLSKELREFPIIWAIGSILGVNRMVDMKFNKKIRTTFENEGGCT